MKVCLSRLSAEHLTNSEHKHNSRDGVVTSKELQEICIKLGGDKNSLFKSLKDGGNVKKSSKGEPEVMIIKENKKKVPEIEGVDAVLKDVDLDNSDIPGAEFVKPVQGFFCQLCKKFFAPGKDVSNFCHALVSIVEQNFNQFLGCEDTLQQCTAPCQHEDWRKTGVGDCQWGTCC